MTDYPEARVIAVNENSAETDDVSQDTMYDTNFVGDSEAQDDTNSDDEQSFGTTYNWGYGDHTTADSEEIDTLAGVVAETADDLDGDVDEDMLAVLEDVQELVGDVSVNDFQCSHPDCGLTHSHGPRKHDIRNDPDCVGVSGFNITDQFAEMMEFVPNCHCGANEAAMLVEFIHEFNVSMFSDQEQFEGVFEMDREVVNQIYQVYHTENESVVSACGIVAARNGLAESAMAPLGLRDDLELFFERRELVENGGENAPIGQDTRNVINELRDEVVEAISE